MSFLRSGRKEKKIRHEVRKGAQNEREGKIKRASDGTKEAKKGG